MPAVRIGQKLFIVAIEGNGTFICMKEICLESFLHLLTYRYDFGRKNIRCPLRQPFEFCPCVDGFPYLCNIQTKRISLCNEVFMARPKEVKGDAGIIIFLEGRRT